MTFLDYLEDTDFIKLYDREILVKKGGGRDHLTPESYRKSFEKEIDWIKTKLADGSYRFSPYHEKLILKGKGKFPRILSIPSVRDRFVFCLLNGYLSQKLGISYMIPNIYITRITDYISKSQSEGKDLFFFKSDISSFFDNINHSVLFNLLVDKIDKTALTLVMRAITTPTASTASEKYLVNTRGVPQGLAISNILAATYVKGFHREMERTLTDCLFLRYVDDVIILSSKLHDFKTIITNCIKKYNLGLELTESKTAEGRIEDGFDFLGYHIKAGLISVRKKNRDNFSNRLTKRCILLRRQFEDPLLRPRFASDDQVFLDYARTDLNLMISGFKSQNHNYGWIAYFQRINDLTLLHQLDKLIKKSLSKEFFEKMSINSIVKTYFGLKESGGENLLTDFDRVIERGKRIAYLRKMGYIKDADTKDISDEEVDRLFNRMVHNFKKHSERDVAEIS